MWENIFKMTPGRCLTINVDIMGGYMFVMKESVDR